MLNSFNGFRGVGSPFNINTRKILVQVPPIIALLETLQSGAAAAYSLRNLSKDTTNVVRVRRSSDNAELDFTAAQINNGSLLTWVGAGNGLVTTWYDQSGNANHATQATAARQPKIVDGGVLVTEGGKAALDFDGRGDELYTDGPVITTNTWFIEAVANVKVLRGNFDTLLSQQTAAGGAGRVSFFQSDPVRIFFNAYDSIYGSNTIVGRSSYSLLTSSLFTSAAFENDYYLATDGQTFERVVDNQPLTPNRPLYIGSSSGTNHCECNIKEIILYPSDQSANRTDIEANIADYYGITLA